MLYIFENGLYWGAGFMISCMTLNFLAAVASSGILTLAQRADQKAYAEREDASHGSCYVDKGNEPLESLYENRGNGGTGRNDGYNYPE